MRKRRLLVVAILLIAWLVIPLSALAAGGDFSTAGPLCPRPSNLKLKALSQTSATISWTLPQSLGTPTKYHIIVKKASDDSEVFNDNAVYAPEFSAEISSLEPGTEYYAMVQANCKDNHHGCSDVSVPFSFSTLVTPVKLPYTYEFDIDKTLPAGWIFTGNVSISDTERYGSVGNSMLLRTNGVDLAMAVTPQFDHTVTDMQFTAYVYADLEVTYQVGLISNVADQSTFFPLHIATTDVDNRNKWHEIRFNSADYVMSPLPANVSFAILLPGGKAAALYVDDMDVRTIPTCVRPEGLKAAGADTVSVSLSWTAVEGVTDYRVAVISADDTVYHKVSQNPARISGLTEHTAYFARIRALCSATDSSEFSHAVAFETSCRTAESSSLKFGFEDSLIPECWVQEQTVKGTGAIGADLGVGAWGIASDKVYSGIRSLQLRATKPGTHTLLVARPIRIAQAGTHHLSFYRYRGEGSADLGDGVTVWLNSRPDTVGGTKLEFIPGSYTQTPAEYAPGWYKYEYSIDRTGVVYFIFEGISRNAEVQYIDDISVGLAPSCARVDNQSISFTDPATDYVLGMKWDPAGSETEWELRYTLTCGLETIVDTVKVTGTPQYDFENLHGGDSYSLTGHLAAVCSATDTSDFVLFGHDFTVPCINDLNVSFTETFETTNSLPNCWISRQTQAGTGSGGDYGDDGWKIVESEHAVSGSRMMQLQGTKKGIRTILVSPSFSVPEGQGYVASLQIYRSSDETPDEGIQVWSNTTPDTVGATKLLSIRHFKGYDPIEFADGVYKYYTPSLPAGKQYLIIEGLGQKYTTWSVLIDDVSVEPVPACSPLRGGAIVDSVASDAVRLRISENTSWQIEYGATGFTLGTGSQLTSTDDGTMLIKEGFTPDTKYTYDVYMRRACGGDVFSDWTKCSVSFHTLCKPYEVTLDAPFIEDFESLNTGSSIGVCYQDLKISGSDDFTVSESQNGISPQSGKKFATRPYKNKSWLFREVYLRAGVSYEASGYFTQDGNMEHTTRASLALATAPDVKAVTDWLAEDVVILNTWTRLNGYFTVPKDGVYYVGWYTDQENGWYNYHAIDNLSVSEIICMSPQSVSVVGISDSSAIVNWTSQADMWEVKVSDATFSPDATTGLIYHDTVYENKVLLKSLAAKTSYYYTVRAICGTDPSTWTDVARFRTQCEPANVPLFQGFEDSELTAMNCWEITGEAWKRSGYKVHSGKMALYTENGGVTMVSPKLDVTSLSDYMLTGWVNAYTVPSSISISVMEDPNDPGTVEEILVFTADQKSTWQQFVVYFSSLSDIEDFDPKYISISTEQTDVCFDDISIDPIPECPRPIESLISDVTHNSFKLGWTSGGDETKWQVVVRNGDNVAVDTVVDRNPSVITGLAATTSYSVEISAQCATDKTSEVTPCGNFTTECAPYTSSYSLYLEYKSGVDLPPCWSLGDGNTDKYYNWHIEDDDEPYILYKGGWATSAPAPYHTLLSPVFDLSDFDGASMYATLRTSEDDDSLFIVLSVDGGVTFPVRLDTIPAGTAKQTFRYDISEYTGTSQLVIGFEGHGRVRKYVETELYSFGIDVVETCTRPQSLFATEIGDTVVTFSLSDSDNSHTAWQVAYGTDVNGYPAMEPQDVTSRQFDVKGLKPLTSYYFYARTKCADGVSSWYGPVKVATACPTHVALPYTQSFESNACVDVIGSADYRQSTSSYSDGYRSLRLETASDKPVFVVFPLIDAPLTGIQMEFDYHFNGRNEHSGFTLGVLTDVSDTTSFIPIKEYPSASDYIPVDFHFNTHPLHLMGDARIALKLEKGSDASLIAFLDNFRFREDALCSFVSDIKVLDVTANGTLTLSATCSADSMQCVYGPAGTAADDCTSSLKSTSGTFSIEGLTPGTPYYVYLRSLCEYEEGFWTKPILVSVPCGVKELTADETWIENFDSYIDSDLLFPSCFIPVTTYYEDGILYPAVSQNTDESGYGLRFKGINAVALPIFNVDADRLIVSFDIKGSPYFNRLSIAMRNSLAPGSSEEVFIRDIRLGNATERHTFDLTLPCAKGKYLVLYTRGREDGGFTIDNIEVKLAPTFYTPRRLNVEAGDTIASASWFGAPDAIKYEYSLTSGTTTVTDVTSATNVELHPLTTTTEYTFTVRAIRGTAVGDTTDWIETRFTTMANASKIPFLTGFEDAKDNLDWQFVQEDVDNKFVIGSDINAVKDGLQAIYISKDGASYAYNNSQGAYGQHAYRTLRMTTGYYRISYDWICDALSGADCAFVHLLPVSYRLNASSVPSVSDIKGAVRLHASDYLSGKPSWQHEEMVFEVTADGYYNLAISWKNYNRWSNQPPITIDNISIEEVVCQPFTAVTVDSLSINSAFIVIDNPTDEGMVEYRLLSAGEELKRDIVITDTIAFRESLQPVTAYAVEVRPYCGEGIEREFSRLDFTTLTPPVDVPADFSLDNVTAAQASFSWTSEVGKYQFRLFCGTELLCDSTLDRTSILIEDLTPNTAYRADVRAVEADEYSLSAVIDFRTECEEYALPYDMDFNAVAGGSLPDCWDVSSGSALVRPTNWSVLVNGSERMLGLSLTSAEGHNEVRTPEFHIDQPSACLTFDYANTSLTDTLRLCVSIDRGETFADTLLEAVNIATTQSFVYELSDYLDKSVMFAFCANTTFRSPNKHMAVDNLRISCKTDDKVLLDSVCAYDDAYVKNGFSIPADQFVPGTTIERTMLVKATTAQECDYYSTLRLYVRRGGEYPLKATICEGKPYISDAFPEGLTESSTYRSEVPLKTTDGCDSIVILTLTVANPRLEINDTICQGDKYPFAGRELTEQGVYYDTVPTPYGCDSITTLILSVAQTSFEDSKMVCEKDVPYMWEGQTLTATGRYVHDFTNEYGCPSQKVINFTVLPDTVRIDTTICYGQSYRLGITDYDTTGFYTYIYKNKLQCDSLVELTLTVALPDTVRIEDRSCQGKPYYGHGFKDVTITRDTVLLRSDKDPEGCISFTSVAIDYIDNVVVYDTVEIQAGGSYIFCGNTYKDAGTYTCTEPSAEGCDSITHLTIQVTTATDLTTAQPLILAPNPIGTGDIAYIYRTWTSEEQHGLRVEVINSIGQVIVSDTPDYYPITINSIDVSGIYYVRITTGTGDVYIGRLVVR